MNKKRLAGVFIFLFSAFMLSGCVKLPYENGNILNMPENFEANIEEVEIEQEQELEAIITIDEAVTDETGEGVINTEEETEEFLSQIDLDTLSEELPEGVFKRIVIDEKETVSLDIRAEDPDGNKLMYEFGAPLNQEGIWETQRGDVGEYLVNITVSDGDLSTSAKILIVVNSINKEPIMEQIEKITIQEGGQISLSPVATDANEDTVIFSYSGLMGQSIYNVSYDEVICSAKIFDCSEVFTTTITAKDGFSEVTQNVEIEIINTNRVPLMEPIEDITVDELETIELLPATVDPDEDELEISFTSPFNGQGILETKRGDVGEYVIYVTSSDGDLSTSEKFTLTINSINEDPILESIVDITVDETEEIVLSPVATDANEDEITFSYSGWMDSNTYSTTYNDAGEHIVTITATDKYGGVDSIDVNINVENVNRPPVILGVY